MYANPGGPPPQRTYPTQDERAKLRSYGLSVLMQAFGSSKFVSKLPAVVDRAEDDAFKKHGHDQALYVQLFQKKIEASKDGIMKLMHQPRQVAHGAATQQPHHQPSQHSQFSQAGMQHALPPPPQQPMPQVRAQQLEMDSVMAAPEQPVVEQGDDFNDFLGAFVAPTALQQQQPQQQPPPQMAQSMFAQQQQPQPGVSYPQQNVAAVLQQQQAGPALGRSQPTATAAAQQQQMHLAGKMAGLQGNHAGQIAGMQTAGYPQAMAAAQMGVSLAARTAGGQAAFNQPAHGAPGVAPAQPGVMGAPGGMGVDQGMAGMYGGGVSVQPGVAAQHGPTGGGMMGMPGQQAQGIMGQLPQQQQHAAGVGMAVAGSGGNAGAGPMSIMQQQQQQAAPHTHAHNAGASAPGGAPPIPYGIPPTQQQDISYAHLNQQQQLIAQHQAAVAAAAQQAQAVQQQQQQQQQQQVAAATVAQQQHQTAQMLARVASGGLQPQAAAAAGAAVAAAAAAAASRSMTPIVPMGTAASVAQMSRAQPVPGAAMPGGPALATQQPPQQASQPQQAPAGSGMQVMGAGAGYVSMPAAAGLPSQAIGLPTAAAPPPVAAPAAMPTAAATMAVPVTAAAVTGAVPPAATTPVPAAPAAAAAAGVPGGVRHPEPETTPEMVEDYWRVISGLKSRLSLLRAHLEKYSKAAVDQSSDTKASRSKRILLEAYKRCTVEPGSPEYASMVINASHLKMLRLVLSSLDSNTAMVRRQAAPQPAAVPTAGVQGAAAPGAPHEGAATARPMPATPPLPQPHTQQQQQQYPGSAVAAANATANTSAIKLEGGAVAGGGMVGVAPSPPGTAPVVAAPAPTAATTASRAAAAAVVAAAAHNMKLRGIKPNPNRLAQFKASGDAATLGKTALESELGGRVAHQGRDAKLERTGDSQSPAVDQVTRLLGLLAQPLPHATLRVHASRGAADVLNFDWDSLMPSLPAAACAQLTKAAAAAAAAAAVVGPPRARTVSVCRVLGMSYSNSGAAAAVAGANGSVADSVPSGRGAVSRALPSANGGGDGSAAMEAGAVASPELKRRREAVEAACQEAREELGPSVALRLLDSGEGEAMAWNGGLEAEAWLMECEAAGSLDRAEEDDPRSGGAVGATSASGGASGPPWKRMRVCVPWDYPEAPLIPTFASTDAAYTHPYGRAARLHFQTALQSGHVAPHLSIRMLAKVWRDAVTKVCGAVRTADAPSAQPTATPAVAV